jgi:hypothetical protein
MIVCCDSSCANTFQIFCIDYKKDLEQVLLSHGLLLEQAAL